MKVISKAAARAAGLSKYYTGIPCKYGHDDVRIVCNGICATCASINYKRWYRRNQKAQIERCNAWRKIPERRAARGLPVPTRPCPSTCEVCGGPPGKRAMNIDHCHKTGKFRGWLCGSCNRGLGQFRDNVEHMQKAVAYLLREGA